MPDDSGHLKEFFKSGKSPVRGDSHEEAGAADLMLGLGDGYSVCSRVQPKPVFTLHCHRGKEGYRSFQYVHLDSNSSFQVTNKRHVIVLRFCGLKPVEVTITGLNLIKLYDYIHQHRMPVIRMADRDFAGDEDEIITAIDIKPVEEGALSPASPC